MSDAMDPDVAEALKQLKQGFSEPNQRPPPLRPASSVNPPPAKMQRTVPPAAKGSSIPVMRPPGLNLAPQFRPGMMMPGLQDFQSFGSPTPSASKGGTGAGQIGPQIGPTPSSGSQIGPQMGPSPGGPPASGFLSSPGGGGALAPLPYPSGGGMSSSSTAGGMTMPPPSSLTSPMQGLGGMPGNLGAVSGGLAMGQPGMAGGGMGVPGGIPGGIQTNQGGAAFPGVTGMAGLAQLAPNLTGNAAAGGGPPLLPTQIPQTMPPGLGFSGIPNLAPMAAVGMPMTAAVPAGPPKTQVKLEVPQASVGLIIGKQAVTINAIKAYSKANVSIEQQTPDEGRAQVTLVGAEDEITKAKRVVDGLVDGSMSTSVLYQMAGVGSGGAPVAGAAPPPGAMPGMTGAMPGMPGGAMGMFPQFPQMVPQAMPGGMTMMPPPNAPQAAGVGLAAASMQDHLNDYYAQWWAQCGNKQMDGEAGGNGAASNSAFDPEALKKLAEKANEPAPAFDLAALSKLAQAPAAAAPAEDDDDDMDVSDDDKPAAPAPVNSAPPGPPQAAPSRGMTMPPPPPPAPPARPNMPPGPPGQETHHSGFSPIQFANQTGFSPPVPQGFSPPVKDNDAVKKMMFQMQGNAQATKDVGGKVAATAAQVAAQAAAQAAAAAFSQAHPSHQPGIANAFEQRGAADNSIVEALEQRAQAARSSEECEGVAKEVLQQIPVLPPDQVFEMLRMTEVVVKRLRGDMLKELSNVLGQRLKASTSSQFSLLISTFLLWSTEAREKLSDKCSELVNVVTSEMTERLMELAPAEVNSCLISLMALGHTDHKFLSAVCRACVARHNSFGPGELGKLLMILAELRLVHVDLFQASGQSASHRARELRAGETMRLMRAFAKCNQPHSILAQAIGDHVASRWKAKGIKSGFKCEELVELSWCFCVMQSYHEELFRLMFKQLQETPKVSNEALCQLYEVHLTLDSEHKEAYQPYRIADSAVQLLMDHYTKQRKDKDASKAASRQRDSVASSLKSLTEAHVQTNHRTGTGMLVDVAALRKRTSTDGFVHVEIDTASTLFRPIDQEDVKESQFVVEGPVALRRRILQKNGLKLITVREAEWKQLDESKERRRHLRTQLSSLGAGLVE